LTSCSTVRVPDSDPTPPTAEIVMSRLPEINKEELTEYELQDDSNLIVIGTGHDADGGIRNIKLMWSITTTCEHNLENLNSTQIDTEESQNPDPNDPEIPARAKKLRAIVFNITPEVIAQWKAECDFGDFEFKELEVQFLAVDSKFSGGTDHTELVRVHMLAPAIN